MALQALTLVAEREGGTFLWRRRQYDSAAISPCRGRSSHVGGAISACHRRPETAVPESDSNSGELRRGRTLWAQLIGKDVCGDDFRGRSVWPSRPFCYYLP